MRMMRVIWKDEAPMWGRKRYQSGELPTHRTKINFVMVIWMFYWRSSDSCVNYVLIEWVDGRINEIKTTRTPFEIVNIAYKIISCLYHNGLLRYIARTMKQLSFYVFSLAKHHSVLQCMLNRWQHLALIFRRRVDLPTNKFKTIYHVQQQLHKTSQMVLVFDVDRFESVIEQIFRLARVGFIVLLKSSLLL